MTSVDEAEFHRKFRRDIWKASKSGAPPMRTLRYVDYLKTKDDRPSDPAALAMFGWASLSANSDAGRHANSTEKGICGNRSSTPWMGLPSRGLAHVERHSVSADSPKEEGGVGEPEEIPERDLPWWQELAQPRNLGQRGCVHLNAFPPGVDVEAIAAAEDAPPCDTVRIAPEGAHRFGVGMAIRSPAGVGDPLSAAAGPDLRDYFPMGWPTGPYGGGDPTDPTDGPWLRLGCNPSIISWIASIECAGMEGEAAEAAETSLESAQFGVDWECACAFLAVDVSLRNGTDCEFTVSCIYTCVCEASMMYTQDGRPVA